MKSPFGRGPTTLFLGDFITTMVRPWLLTTYKPWDDIPAVWLGVFAQTFRGKKGCLHPLKLTANAPENRRKPKRTRSYCNHPFSGANCYFQGGYN